MKSQNLACDEAPQHFEPLMLRHRIEGEHARRSEIEAALRREADTEV
ncbi:hypothetical protein [Rubrivivax gelatinosus]|uniref:Uncharacterized protein n=1 Tax=Rubrivivax gelatinosus (strain NBRC 100245 / IL144) TaxID=983917 RepID=I0HVM7_RUBGI|nr:hypothetical protein [Rubrivivax gelatinosus]MBG6078995.1 hypothetical protein [Rubrivivax gelatinosus]BAL97064.1 hypothetical protein RGE_37250 [Rubrivivax gelatinosus IL144]